jgi:hypothetical protein
VISLILRCGVTESGVGGENAAFGFWLLAFGFWFLAKQKAKTTEETPKRPATVKKAFGS